VATVDKPSPYTPRMRCRALVILAAVCTSTVVLAQTGTPSIWVFRIYQAGTTTQVGIPVTVTAANVPCDLAPVTGMSNVNPNRWRFTDPARPLRQCEYPDSTRLGALSDGSYEGTITAGNVDGSSAETARIPFVRRRLNPPAVPTGGQIIQ